MWNAREPRFGEVPAGFGPHGLLSAGGGDPECAHGATLSLLLVLWAPQRQQLGLVGCHQVSIPDPLSPGSSLIPAERVPHGDRLAERGQHLVPVRGAHPAGCRPNEHMACVVTAPILAALGHCHPQGQLLGTTGLSPHTDPTSPDMYPLHGDVHP